MTIMRLAETVIELTGSASQIELTDPTELWGTAFREAADKVPDISRAKRDLRWQPTIGVRDIIMDCVR
jgi:nucleoside-diphosphate-sugar epimerase